MISDKIYLVKKRNPVLFLLRLALSLFSCHGKQAERKSFHYSQGTQTDYIGQYCYKDSYFATDSTFYNPSLSTCSLSFAISCFGSNRNGSTNDYSKRYRNAEEFLTQNGFTDFDTNIYYKQKPSTDSLGAVFAKKKLGDYTLIACGVRGGNYEQEWASNVTLGDGIKQKQAQGFYEASTIYLNSFEDYIKEKNITGKVKIWTVGYSRGGATNNLFSGRLDQRIKDSPNLFHTDATLNKEDLYSYCFEPPQGASFLEDVSPRSSFYNNIHNIVNFNDPVPKVARSATHFTRYGVDHYLLDPALNRNYSSSINKVLDYYKNRQNYSVLGDYKISSFERSDTLADGKKQTNHWTSGLFLEDFINELVHYGIPSLQYYVEKYQPGLRMIFETVYRNGNPKSSRISIGLALVRTILYESDIDYLFALLTSDPSSFANELILILHDTLKDFDINLDYSLLSTSLKSLFFSLVKVLYHHGDYFPTFLSRDNIKAIGSAHYPELCLSHLRSEDPNFTKDVDEFDSTGAHYILTLDDFTDSTNLTILKDNKIYLEVSNGSISDHSILSCKIESNILRCILPNETGYEIKVENAKYTLNQFEQSEEYPFLLEHGEASESVTITTKYKRSKRI